MVEQRPGTAAPRTGRRARAAVGRRRGAASGRARACLRDEREQQVERHGLPQHARRRRAPARAARSPAVSVQPETSSTGVPASAASRRRISSTREAVEARQHHVERDERRAQLADAPERTLAVVHGLDPPARLRRARARGSGRSGDRRRRTRSSRPPQSPPPDVSAARACRSGRDDSCCSAGARARQRDAQLSRSRAASPSRSGERSTPRSVTSAVTSAAGVTSKAGWRTRHALAARRRGPPMCATSSRPRSSIGMASPSRRGEIDASSSGAAT